MKLLIFYSGSPGHFLGVMHFVEQISIKINVVFASHIGMPDKLQKSYPYVHMTTPPAFLDYEFLHHKDLKQVISLKSDKVYYHNRKQVLKQLIKELRPDAILLDGISRKTILEFLNEVHRVDTLGVFSIRDNISLKKVVRLYHEYKYRPE